MPGAAITSFFLDSSIWAPVGVGGILKLGSLTYDITIPLNSVLRERTVAFGNVDFEEPC